MDRWALRLMDSNNRLSACRIRYVWPCRVYLIRGDDGIKAGPLDVVDIKAVVAGEIWIKCHPDQPALAFCINGARQIKKWRRENGSVLKGFDQAAFLDNEQPGISLRSGSEQRQAKTGSDDIGLQLNRLR